MLANLEALLALNRYGTMVRAATHLHLTQSTISKRIQALEAQVGQALIVKDGRRVRLTERGAQLVHESQPFLQQFNAIVNQRKLETHQMLSLAVSSGIMISWGPQVLARTLSDRKDLSLELSTYTATIAVERVRSGEILMALCHGTGLTAPDLAAEKLGSEPVVIVPNKLKPFHFPKLGTLALSGSEPHSECWSALSPQIDLLSRTSGCRIEITKTLCSFAALTKLAQAGFGHALVPAAVAQSLGVKAHKFVTFPKPGVELPITLVARKSTFQLEAVRKFAVLLREQVQIHQN